MTLIATGGATLTVVRMTAPAICCLDDISWTHATGAAFGGSLLATSHFLNLKYPDKLTPKKTFLLPI